MGQWMKEPYEKAVAHHLGPESCADGGDAVGEALTGVSTPWPLATDAFLSKLEHRVA